ncbi:hypothetical protein HH310_12400 [Actinoplanes sp. TBRC 11911]|uniref:hypothetical protein n=1 Tax=Actinoplanes sp. TBRC 11911 TaxID=2729386 RepID=UPI00145CA083|nr:hypothetical protein [Actinoplanes sp. TBRC 11911]NMO51994.1 hypothetical protein [Actinoplanes sp. TBRC 11911]
MSYIDILVIAAAVLLVGLLAVRAAVRAARRYPAVDVVIGAIIVVLASVLAMVLFMLAGLPLAYAVAVAAAITAAALHLLGCHVATRTVVAGAASTPVPGRRPPPAPRYGNPGARAVAQPVVVTGAGRHRVDESATAVMDASAIKHRLNDSRGRY